MSEQTIYGSAARTATPTAFDLDLIAIRGLIVVADVTAIVTAPSVVLTIDGVDVVSGKTWNILTATALTAVSTRILRIAPGLVASANLTVNDLVPEKVRFTMTHGNGNSITYSVVAHLLN
jgi:hypothetical protein